MARNVGIRNNRYEPVYDPEQATENYLIASVAATTLNNSIDTYDIVEHDNLELNLEIELNQPTIELFQQQELLKAARWRYCFAILATYFKKVFVNVRGIGYILLGQRDVITIQRDGFLSDVKRMINTHLFFSYAADNADGLDEAHQELYALLKSVTGQLRLIEKALIESTKTLPTINDFYPSDADKKAMKVKALARREERANGK